MRISFDVDDTLVCGPRVPSEQHLLWALRWRYRERLRLGTRLLLRTLQERGHTLWIYTTSHRSEWYLGTWFRLLGIRLEGIVNQRRHEKEVGRQGPSKYPPAFRIDLHVDDSEGVRMEGDQHRFDVVVVSSDDLNWSNRILDAIARRRS